MMLLHLGGTNPFTVTFYDLRYYYKFYFLFLSLCLSYSGKIISKWNFRSCTQIYFFYHPIISTPVPGLHALFSQSDEL